MEFFSGNGIVRPVRLSDETRRFAERSLSHEFGLDTRKTAAVSLDDVPDFGELNPLEKYAAAIRRIAERCPVRVCDGEKISCSATLGTAIDHTVPATFRGDTVFEGVSHLTIDYETVLREGLEGLKKKVLDSLMKHTEVRRAAFLENCLSVIRSFEIWIGRYLDALRDRPEYADNFAALNRVPRLPARTFREALQSVWSVFAFCRLCGNWPGIGRIDALLGPFLSRDLASGEITLDEARELLAHFMIKGNEWFTGDVCDGGDAQHYQNIVLAGVDGDGYDVTCEVTYLWLDLIEELGISDFPTTVRFGRKTDPALVRRVSEVLRFGGGVIAVYNEDLIIDALVRAGYPPREARKFANDGCWEVQIPGKTYFMYCPFDSLRILQKDVLERYRGTRGPASFEELYSVFTGELRNTLEEIFRSVRPRFEDGDSGCGTWKEGAPCTVVSLFEEGCIDRGLSYFEGGPMYNIVSPHIGGAADTVNSLYAIKKLVFDDKKVTFPELMETLDSNWEGAEEVRRFAANRYVYYGNDSDEVDSLMARLLSDFADGCDSLNGRCGYRFPAGVSTFGRQLLWAPKRAATPFGRKAGDVLAANCSPTPGTDGEGATAVIRSYCKAPLVRLASGAALDIRLMPSAMAGEDGIVALSSMIRGFVTLGGFFMQIDVVDPDLLRAAQEHPEDYGTLSVRVSGWNARFVTLDRSWQDMIIEQNEK